ncbi:MAG: exo-alpha-sialidase [Verrucomicrobia bacterium]|nr:exo-alpha-sialidase [Verrucomicrobiota bacterium]
MNIYPVFKISMSSLFIFFFGNLLIAAASDLSYPDAKTNSKSALMLDLTTSGKDPDAIVYENLIHLPAQPSVVSDVRLAGGLRVNQHAYLAYFGGRFWAMWSDGPGEPRVSPEKHWNVVPGHDRPFTRVSYATSKDGLNWSEVKDLSGPPRTNGFGWIARGLWERDGQLIALASHFNAPGYDGEGLSLEGWRWNNGFMRWEEIGTVLDDAMNNFPPKRLPNGKWMMTRRDHQRQVSVMLGGVSSHSDWTIKPLATYDGATQQPEEPYWYVLPDGKNLVGLFRDNAQSKRIMRAFSTDNGESWTPLVTTNFPDARSKFFALRTSHGYYALVSNSRPERRDPLTLAISRDGLVYTHLFYLVGGRHIDYPHMIEHDGNLFISFSGAKQTVEVLKVSLDAIDRLIE